MTSFFANHTPENYCAHCCSKLAVKLDAVADYRNPPCPRLLPYYVIELPLQLSRQRAELASALEALTRAASEAEQRLEAAAEHQAKGRDTVVSRGGGACARRAGMGKEMDEAAAEH